ncbi:MAG: ribosome-associated translation inhibitor RaiA [Bacteroidota bacterium]
MRLQIHSIHFNADTKLLEFIEKKSEKLQTIYDRITHGEVFLKLEKGDHSRENKVVEIKLNIPGATLFSKHQHTSFEAATDQAVESLRRQIRKHKGKIQDR